MVTRLSCLTSLSKMKLMPLLRVTASKTVVIGAFLKSNDIGLSSAIAERLLPVLAALSSASRRISPSIRRFKASKATCLGASCKPASTSFNASSRLPESTKLCASDALFCTRCSTAKSLCRLKNLSIFKSSAKPRFSTFSASSNLPWLFSCADSATRRAGISSLADVKPAFSTILSGYFCTPSRKPAIAAS